LAGAAASLDGAPDGPVDRNPKYLEAQAQRDEAARQLTHIVVRAPFAGVATGVGATAPGRFLPASTPAFFLVASDRTWVDATPKETELTWVRVGQPAVLKVDTYPGVTWRGVVESISPAAAQEFSLLPAQNTSGNWVKVVQRIPMRIRVLPTGRDLPPLRAGMSVVAEIDTGHARGLPFLYSASGSAPK
jgi:membrane fusion protein (multidrug efflux system)